MTFIFEVFESIIAYDDIIEVIVFELITFVMNTWMQIDDTWMHTIKIDEYMDACDQIFICMPRTMGSNSSRRVFLRAIFYGIVEL